MFQATRSQSKSGTKLQPAGPNTTAEEEGELFGRIAASTRMHLRWLYQVLDDEDHNHLEYWTSQPEYAVTLNEIREYFNYLQRSGVPVFRGLTKEARLKLQGLLRGDPGADQRKYRIWAKRIGVDNVEAVSAFVKHLQTFMHVKPIPNGRQPLAEGNRPLLASSSTLIRNPESVSTSASSTTPELVESVPSSASNVHPESALKPSPSLQLSPIAEAPGELEVTSFLGKPQVDSRSGTPTQLFELQARVRDPIPTASAQLGSNSDREPAPADTPNCPSGDQNTASSSTSNVVPESTPVTPPPIRPSPVVEHVGRPEISFITSEPYIECRSKGIPTPLSILQGRIRGSAPATRTQVNNNIDQQSTPKDASTHSIGTAKPASLSPLSAAPEPVSSQIRNAALESTPKSSLSQQSSSVAKHIGRSEDASISSAPQNESRSKVIPTPLSRLQARIRSPVSVPPEVDNNIISQQTTTKDTSKDSTSIRASTECTRPPTPDDPFKLFVNHPLRVQGAANRERRTRLVPVWKRNVATPGKRSAVFRVWDSAPRIEEVPRPRASGERDHGSLPDERNPGLKDSPGRIANGTQCVGAEYTVEPPATPPGTWDDVSTPPIVTIEEEDIDMNTDNANYENDDDDELVYPQDEHNTSESSVSEIEIDELDSLGTTDTYDEPQTESVGHH